MAGKKQTTMKPTQTKQKANRKPARNRKVRPKRPTNQRGPTRVRAALRAAKRAARIASGPSPSFRQRITATLGTVSANQTGGMEVEMAMSLHPALVKDVSASNQFGPVQAAAGQYAQWKLLSLQLKATPMVGASAISGTAYRASLNITSSPSSTGWSGLGARQHRDLRVGTTNIWNIDTRLTNGPKNTWWVTNTNEPAPSSLGPSIEIHSLGKTMSTYQADPYDGPVFLIEVTATWGFTNYLAQPNMATMSSAVASSASITATAGKPLVMSIPTGQLAQIAHLLPAALPAANADGVTVADVIYLVADTAISAVSTVLAPPWNWLLKGGWWFVRAVTGLASNQNGETDFYIYASMSDAQAGKPAIVGVTASALNAPQTIGKVSLQQINPPATSGEVALTQAVNTTPSPGGAYEISMNLRGLFCMQNAQGWTGFFFEKNSSTAQDTMNLNLNFPGTGASEIPIHAAYTITSFTAKDLRTGLPVVGLPGGRSSLLQYYATSAANKPCTIYYHTCVKIGSLAVNAFLVYVPGKLSLGMPAASTTRKYLQQQSEAVSRFQTFSATLNSPTGTPATANYLLIYLGTATAQKDLSGSIAEFTTGAMLPTDGISNDLLARIPTRTITENAIFPFSLEMRALHLPSANQTGNLELPAPAPVEDELDMEEWLFHYIRSVSPEAEQRYQRALNFWAKIYPDDADKRAAKASRPDNWDDLYSRLLSFEDDIEFFSLSADDIYY